MRIDVIKKIGFPEETCPKCNGDSDACKLRNGTGTFKQLVCENWQYPELQAGEKLVAILDWDEWCYCGVVDKQDELVVEVHFPFCTKFATVKHFETLGFEVQRT